MVGAVFGPLKLVVALALCCCLLLIGCYPNKFKTKAAQVSQVVLVSQSDPASFNYAINDSPYSIFPFIYTGLMDENAVNNKLEPGLAQSWSISGDHQRITFTLRPGAKVVRWQTSNSR